MVMKRWSDACTEASSPETGVNFIYSEGGDSAAFIAARHGYNKVESDVLACLFSAFSTMALVLNSSGRSAFEINCRSNGAIGGFHIRVTDKGEICGYLFNRVNENISNQDVSSDDFFNFIFGSYAKLDATRFDNEGRKTDVFSMFDVSPRPDELLKHCIKKYTNREVETVVTFGHPDVQNCSHTIVILNFDGARSMKTFNRLTSKESVSKIQEIFAICPSLSAFRVELDLLDLITGPNLTIQPGCTCNQKAVNEQYKKVSDSEFRQLGKCIEKTETHELYCYEFRCNCCGKKYELVRSYKVEQE